MKIGLITYHSAYNFGSVLQAYALQNFLVENESNCEIINYRMKEQRRVYSIFRWNSGIKWWKSLIKNILLISRYKSKKVRQQRYEKLINQIFNLSKECVEPKDVYNIWDKYDVIISGSDQIWNKHSNELEHISWDYMYPYLLHGYKGKKVSYASSIANMTDEDLLKIIPDIKDFDFVSLREKESADRLSKICDINIVSVLDPTFLLKKDEWIEKFNLKKSREKYILYYALNGRKDIKAVKGIVEEYAMRKKCKVKIIAPLAYIRSSKNIEVLDEIDPIIFLQLLYNAQTIITDSYHGTILSINLGKDIYSICGRNESDFRKTDILKQIGLEDRIIYDLKCLLKKIYTPIDYKVVNDKLANLRKQSEQYLDRALNE